MVIIFYVSAMVADQAIQAEEQTASYFDCITVFFVLMLPYWLGMNANRPKKPDSSRTCNKCDGTIPPEGISGCAACPEYITDREAIQKNDLSLWRIVGVPFIIVATFYSALWCWL